MRFLLEELNSDSKAKAIQNVIAFQEIALRHRLNRIREEVKGKGKLNTVINSNPIPSLVKRINHIKKMKNDPKYAEEITLENRVEFTEDGRYICYLKPDYNLDEGRFIYWRHLKGENTNE